jgi:hypothetical protein
MGSISLGLYGRNDKTYFIGEMDAVWFCFGNETIYGTESK